MSKLSPEEAESREENFQKRVKAHNEVAILSMKKNKLGLGAVPYLTSDGRILARAIYFDDTKEKVAQPTSPTDESEPSDDTIPQV